MLSGQESDHLTILLISRWELHNAPQPRVGLRHFCDTKGLSSFSSLLMRDYTDFA